MCAHEKVCCARRQEVYFVYKGRRPSPREGAPPLLFLYGHSPMRGNKQIWLFLPLPTKQRVKSAAVGVLWLVANFRVPQGSRNADVVFTPLDKEPSL